MNDYPETHPEFVIGPLAQVFMRASDLERAAAFYCDALGATERVRTEDAVFVDLGGVRVMLGRPQADEFDHAGSVLYFRVDDVDTAYTALRERAVAFRSEPHVVHRNATHEQRVAFLDDTEGNTLAVMDERPRSAG